MKTKESMRYLILPLLLLLTFCSPKEQEAQDVVAIVNQEAVTEAETEADKEAQEAAKIAAENEPAEPEEEE